MFGKKTRDRLAAIEAALEGVAATQVRQADSLDLKTPGGLSAVMSVSQDAAADAKAAREHAEFANAGMQALASSSTAHTDALKSMEETVKAATGPQPVLKDVAVTRPDPVKPKGTMASGMGTRLPKNGGKM